MDDVADSVRRYRSRLEDAMTRGGTARAEARECMVGFREYTEELTEQARDGARPDGASATAAGQREFAADFRDREHLPVPEFPDSSADPAVGSSKSGAVAPTEGSSGPAVSQSRTSDDPGEEGFSQPRMRR